MSNLIARIANNENRIAPQNSTQDTLLGYLDKLTDISHLLEDDKKAVIRALLSPTSPNHQENIRKATEISLKKYQAYIGS